MLEFKVSKEQGRHAGITFYFMGFNFLPAHLYILSFTLHVYVHIHIIWRLELVIPPCNLYIFQIFITSPREKKENKNLQKRNNKKEKNHSCVHSYTIAYSREKKNRKQYQINLLTRCPNVRFSYDQAA